MYTKLKWNRLFLKIAICTQKNGRNSWINPPKVVFLTSLCFIFEKKGRHIHKVRKCCWFCIHVKLQMCQNLIKFGIWILCEGQPPSQQSFEMPETLQNKGQTNKLTATVAKPKVSERYSSFTENSWNNPKILKITTSPIAKIMEPTMKIKIKFFLCRYINMNLSSPKQYYFCSLKGNLTPQLKLLEEIPEIVQFWTAVTTLVL